MISTKKSYNIEEVVEMIQSSMIMIPIEKMFHKDHSHITKKEYGKILIEELCKELKEKHS